MILYALGIASALVGMYPWQILTSGSDLSSGSDDDGQRKRMRVTGKGRGRMTCSASDTEEVELSPAQYVSGPRRSSHINNLYISVLIIVFSYRVMN